jgi:hypothetical protein
MLCEWTQCCRAYLAFDAATVCVDAEAVFLCALFVVLFPCSLGSRVNVGDWAVSLRWSEEARDLFLCQDTLDLLALYIFVYFLLGACVSDAGLVCGCWLCCACLEP